MDILYHYLLYHNVKFILILPPAPIPPYPSSEVWDLPEPLAEIVPYPPNLGVWIYIDPPLEPPYKLLLESDFPELSINPSFNNKYDVSIYINPPPPANENMEFPPPPDPSYNGLKGQSYIYLLYIEPHIYS